MPIFRLILKIPLLFGFRLDLLMLLWFNLLCIGVYFCRTYDCKAVTSLIDGKETHVCHIVIESGVNKENVLKAIQEHCREKLPANHMPHYFKIYEGALPVAPSGKLDTQTMKRDTEKLEEI